MRLSRVFWASLTLMILLFYLPFFLGHGFYGFPIPVVYAGAQMQFVPPALLIDLFFLVAVPFIVNFIYVSSRMNKEERKKIMPVPKKERK